MNKKLIVIGGIIIVIIVSFIVLFFVGQKNNSTTGIGGSTGTLPVVTSTTATPASIPTSTIITLGTPDGSVTTTNFYTSTSSTITPDGQTVIIQDQVDYNIEYNVPDSSFVILLLSTPLQTARQEAEAAFLASLGVSQQNACKLSVYEAVPIGTSDEYPGEDFPLSFCGGPATL